MFLSLQYFVDEIFVPPWVSGEFRVEGGCNDISLLHSHHRPLGLQGSKHFDLRGDDLSDAWGPYEDPMAGCAGRLTREEVRVEGDGRLKTR